MGQDTSGYSAAISACGHDCAGSRGGDLLIKWMDGHVERNTITYNAVLSVCGKAHSWLRVEPLAVMAVALGMQGAITLGAAFGACLKAGVWSRAVVLSAMMAVDCVVRFAVTYHAAVSACRLGGKYVGLFVAALLAASWGDMFSHILQQSGHGRTAAALRRL